MSHRAENARWLAFRSWYGFKVAALVAVAVLAGRGVWAGLPGGARAPGVADGGLAGHELRRDRRIGLLLAALVSCSSVMIPVCGSAARWAR